MSPTARPPPLEPCDRLRTASETDDDGVATLPKPWLPLDAAPGVSNASLGFSSVWICGGGGACTPSGSFGPLSLLAASILGGSGMAVGWLGLGGGVDIARALGRLVDGGEGGT